MQARRYMTGRPQLVCGECGPCRRGQYNVCEKLRVQAFQADGVAQDYFITDEDRVVVLPDGMSLDYGAMIEPVASVRILLLVQETLQVRMLSYQVQEQ